jgi:hypothetical protein
MSGITVKLLGNDSACIAEAEAPQRKLRMKYYVLVIIPILILTSSGVCQERGGTDPGVALPLLQYAFGKEHVSGSIAYWGRCDIHKPYPDFPPLVDPVNYSDTAVNLLREIFKNDQKMAVTLESQGLLRMTETDVPTDLLDVRIQHVSFGSSTQGTDMFNGPNNALRAILFAPEVVAYKRAHNIGPFADRWSGPGDSASSGPQVTGDLNDVTVKEALDFILRTYPGFWIYQNCKSQNLGRDVFIAFYRVDVPSIH